MKKITSKKQIQSSKTSPDPKIVELQHRLNRSLADYQNLEKRLETQKQVFLTFSLMSIFDKLLSTIDDFYLVNHHLRDKGLQIALNKLESVLKSEGLEEIDALDKIFDPHTMDCVETTNLTSKDVVYSVQKKGYKFNGQVVRPAQVVVGTKV